jgi:simple sugar transport system permease protein
MNSEATGGIGLARERPRPSWMMGVLRSHPAANIILVFVAVQLFCVAGWLIFPNSFRYLDAANIAIMLRTIPLLGTVAIGVGILMIAGEFDLSVGAVFVLTS